MIKGSDKTAMNDMTIYDDASATDKLCLLTLKPSSCAVHTVSLGVLENILSVR